MTLANNLLRKVGKSLVQSVMNSSSSASSAFSKLDPFQEALLNEQCILVNENDQEVGQASKRQCHLKNKADDSKAPLHRAFSFFMFDKDNRLLMQQRSDTKITFPGKWTNTCCSHPLYQPELEEKETRDGLGAKRAAQRKVLQELGIKLQVQVQDIEYITRILYAADSNDQWAEHELDYILFLKSTSPIHMEPNPEEVKNVMFLQRNQLNEFIKETGEEHFTPWFLLMSQSLLPKWWENIHNLKPFVDHENITRY